MIKNLSSVLASSLQSLPDGLINWEGSHGIGDSESLGLWSLRHHQLSVSISVDSGFLTSVIFAIWW